jgi:hypothetical protein
MTADSASTAAASEPAATEPGSRPHPGGDQHTICLDGSTPALTHPATCPDPAACPFTAAAGSVTTPLLATGGTWTCDLNGGALILLKRITAPA